MKKGRRGRNKNNIRRIKEKKGRRVINNNKIREENKGGRKKRKGKIP